MNFLALCQRGRRKCRMPGTGPLAVTGQSEEYSRLIDFINEAWNDIQRRHTDWRFLRASATAVTVDGQSAYSPTADFALTDFGYWALDFTNGDTFRNYDTAAGISSEIFMDVWDYDWWRNAYLYGALRTSYARPIGVAVAPDNALVCGPIPAAGYTLVGDYYKVPSDLVLATDIPSLPAQFHMAIVYRAMMFYGASEAAPEVYGEGKDEFDKILRQIEQTQLRRPTLGGALA